MGTIQVNGIALAALLLLVVVICCAMNLYSYAGSLGWVRWTSPVALVSLVLASLLWVEAHLLWPSATWPRIVWFTVLAIELKNIVVISLALAEHLTWLRRNVLVFRSREPMARGVGSYEAPFDGIVTELTDADFEVERGAERRRFPFPSARERLTLGARIHLRYLGRDFRAGDIAEVAELRVEHDANA